MYSYADSENNGDCPTEKRKLEEEALNAAAAHELQRYLTGTKGRKDENFEPLKW